MPKLLHQQKGLRIVQNDKNGFIVVTLHYTADPKKRSAQWKKEAHQGLSPARFAQEYEIDYTALFGEKAFPEIKDRRMEICVKSPFVDGWPRSLPMWGGFDYGAKNPSSFHVYTVVDQVLYAIWELYEPCKNMIEFAKKMKACPYWDQLRYIAADPDIANLKRHDMGTGDATSVMNQFIQLGITKLVPSATDEAAWMAMMRKHWQAKDVTFKIIEETCPMMIAEFEDATYVSMTERQLETQNYREQLVDRKNHSLDDCKYFMNSQPSFRNTKIKLPNLVKSYANW
jgi:hypothetical protein